MVELVGLLFSGDGSHMCHHHTQKHKKQKDVGSRYYFECI